MSTTLWNQCHFSQNSLYEEKWFPKYNIENFYWKKYQITDGQYVGYGDKNYSRANINLIVDWLSYKPHRNTKSRYLLEKPKKRVNLIASTDVFY